MSPGSCSSGSWWGYIYAVQEIHKRVWTCSEYIDLQLPEHASNPWTCSEYIDLQLPECARNPWTCSEYIDLYELQSYLCIFRVYWLLEKRADTDWWRQYPTRPTSQLERSFSLNTRADTSAVIVTSSGFSNLDSVTIQILPSDHY